METEIWKDIPGYEGLYQASDHGRVRSLDRVVNGKYGNKAVKKGKIMTPHIAAPYPGAEPRWTTMLTKNKHTRTISLARCVWSAFNGPIPEGMQVNHIYENPSNNNLDNLNLMTPKENTNWATGIARRAKTHSTNMKGKHLYGENPKARYIMEYDKEGNEFFLWYSIKAAAEYHKKDYSTIMCILSGKSKAMRNGISFKYYKKEAV